MLLFYISLFRVNLVTAMIDYFGLPTWIWCLFFREFSILAFEIHSIHLLQFLLKVVRSQRDFSITGAETQYAKKSCITGAKKQLHISNNDVN